MLTNNGIPTSTSEDEALRGLLSTLVSVSIQSILPSSLNWIFTRKDNSASEMVPYSAYQIPMFISKIRLDTPRFFTTLRELIGDQGTEIHYWVANDLATIKRLYELGADAVITDRTDLAVQALKKLDLYSPPKWDEKIKQIKGVSLRDIDLIEIEEVHVCTSVPCMIIENYLFIIGGLLFMSLVCGYQIFCYCCCYPISKAVKVKNE